VRDIKARAEMPDTTHNMYIERAECRRCRSCVDDMVMCVAPVCVALEKLVVGRWAENTAGCEIQLWDYA
jgi:hypothetical protein